MKSFLNWSGGKDACLALWKMQQDGFSPSALLTSISAGNDRVSMHGVPRALVAAQAEAIGLPLHILPLPEMPGMQAYENALATMHAGFKNNGFTHAVYGDIFLEDLKQYRGELLKDHGLQGYFPLWKMDTRALLEEFWEAGFKALVVAVDGSKLGKGFCGRTLDPSFLADLPAGIDVCGENGEFHTFVYDGPLFAKPVSFTQHEILEKCYPAPRADDCFTDPRPAVPFYFCDIS